MRATASSAVLYGYPYLIETADGKVVRGRTDSTRLLLRIYTDGADTYAIHWGEEALSHEGWDNAE